MKVVGETILKWSSVYRVEDGVTADRKYQE